jgi:hypothetical protein
MLNSRVSVPLSGFVIPVVYPGNVRKKNPLILQKKVQLCPLALAG